MRLLGSSAEAAGGTVLDMIYHFLNSLNPAMVSVERYSSTAPDHPQVVHMSI